MRPPPSAVIAPQPDPGLGTSTERSRRALRAFRLMLAVWVTLGALICLRTVLHPKRNSVYPIFADAGQGWLHGTDLYDDHFWLMRIDEYRYSPLVAASFAPLSQLPNYAGGILWRMLNAAVFLAGAIALFRTLYPGPARLSLIGATCIGWLLLPLALPSLNNGQANPIVIGGLMLAIVAAHSGRWNLAALALAVPILIKVYPLAVALLLLLAYPRQLGWRLAVVLLLGLAIPFALQDPAYVARQYDEWFAKLLREDRSQRIITESYRDCWLLIRWTHLPLPHLLYLPLQLATAAGIGAVILVGRLRRWRPAELLVHLFNLGCCWMILFGPATENSTYILIAPTFALAVWEAFAHDRPVWTRGLLAAIVGIFVGSAILTALPEGRNWAYPLNPLATLLLFAERLWSLAAPVRQAENSELHAPTAAAA
jgi:Glycosyltransferase family 87